MKLLLASFASGILVTIGILGAVLFLRALFRDEASVMFALWLFGWPMWLLRCLPGISAQSLVWLSLAIGLVLDALLISLGIYFVLRMIVSRIKRAPAAVPPQPPTF
jgi:CHASE1-domain containing sensor protein